jgi:hypothetical protein
LYIVKINNKKCISTVYISFVCKVLAWCPALEAGSPSVTGKYACVTARYAPVYGCRLALLQRDFDLREAALAGIVYPLYAAIS